MFIKPYIKYCFKVLYVHIIERNSESMERTETHNIIYGKQKQKVDLP